MIPFIAAAQAASTGTKIAIVVSIAAALFSVGLYIGHKWGVSSCLEATIEAQRHTIETGQKQGVVSDKVVTQYIDRIQTVEGKTRTIIKEVPIYVKDNCTLSGGFRMLHDSAVNNELPDSASIADAAPVEVETVAEQQ